MRRLRHEDAAHDDEAGEGSRPRKQRKQRPYYSCAGELAKGGQRWQGDERAASEVLISYARPECRRLKMKCDREGKIELYCNPSIQFRSRNKHFVAVPCSNCVRRHRVEFCIAGPAPTTITRLSRFVLSLGSGG